jgi:mRNA-degrading endonuclease toxin of MazEF toxin-antitoxin module
LLVVPITSQPARMMSDVPISDCQSAGLRLPSTVRVEKLATIEKTCVARKLGVLPSDELTRVRQALAGLFRQILA